MEEGEEDVDLVVGLAGNPNVGKSALFHQFTGIGVNVSNYPGTTVEIAEGEIEYEDKTIKLVDLPGVYSLRAVSEDEWVARRAILELDIDVVIDVVDASNLERNLYLTLQLVELGIPLVVSLNQYDSALEKGMRINPEILSEKLGVPVIETVATRGENVSEVFVKALKTGIKGEKPERRIEMGRDLEESVKELSEVIGNMDSEPSIPPRSLALMLLEGDEEVLEKLPEESRDEIIRKKEECSKKIEKQHEEEAEFRIARERHGIASLISEEASERVEAEPLLSEKISRWTTEFKTGIPILVGVFFGLLTFLIFGGGFLEKHFLAGWNSLVEPPLRNVFDMISPSSQVADVLNIGINKGMKGILAVMFPYLPPFFLLLAVLEDSGYLSRMAYLLDSTMHKIGLHGKAVAPMLGGFGCNVPAIMATRGMTDRRQRLISSFLITLVPCSARTAVILGTVGVFVGVFPALVIYGIIISLIFISGLVLNRFLPGETSGMVMEMPPLRKPMLRPVLSKTWNRLKEFIYVATPLLILGSLIIGVLDVSGIMNSLVDPLSPVTSGLLGLEPIVIIPLIYGVIRKEGALVLLMSVTSLGQMKGLQLFVFALVVAIYIPCIATFSVLRKELGWKEAIIISLSTILLALAMGGLFYHLNPLGLQT
ncbi:hypothetical protein AKJ65_03720 [candidate division MSBL1 archaeon SCGC-AAA259E19]|uniref:Ferrous iron transport protein B n=1 Tax=candidate division MSBL1 archaeon SCGC-AAA259E19 TaxID=1698264 RepID=A0A133UKI0_9EURY|nr:hypothetical protein AKJ65_03720 [candidate division MSBL1 archaeon SCGC-AAA259E19]